MSRRDPTLWSPDGDDPPDWALPSWDSLPADRAGEPRRPAGSAPAGPAACPRLVGRPARASSPTSSGRRSWASARSPGPSATPSGPTTGCATCGSRARSGGSRSRRAGHAYFTLKDERSQLSCVWFRDDRLTSPFEPRTGLRVVAHGRIDVFDQQGVYQLYVERRPAGRLRRPRPPVRGAQGPARRRGPVRRRPQAAAAGPAGGDRRRRRARPAPSGTTSGTSSSGAGRWPGSSSPLPGPGRAGAGEHRRGPRPDRPLRRAVRPRRAARRMPRR